MSLLKSLLTFGKSRFIRIQDDSELEASSSRGQDYGAAKFRSQENAEKIRGGEGCFKAEHVVFAEDYHRVQKTILDPRGPVVRHWNELFLVVAMISLFIDPLFLFLPKISPNLCIEDLKSQFKVLITFLRSLTDFFYVINMLVQFRTAYVAPSSRVIGRGELVIDPWQIAYRYLRRGFWFDLLASLPFPQVMNWMIIPYSNGSATVNLKIVLRIIPLSQYLLRFFLLYPLSSKILKDTGKMTETAWVGAAYNMLLFYIASNVSGACWYLLTIERQEACWRSVCDSIENQTCVYGFFDCSTVNDTDRANWFSITNTSTLCNPIPTNSYYEYGIYLYGLQNNAQSEVFVKKYFFCFYWALQSLTSIGNNLATTDYVGENIFVNLVAILGLVLLSALVGNMQRYLQSTSVRLEEWRQKRTEAEQWMHHRQIPAELRQSVRKYEQYKWVATRGVEEKTIISSLPKDLQRKINHHLCYNLIKQVPLLSQMDDHMLDGICERLKPVLFTEGMFLVREGDPVKEMLFIIRGRLDSYTTNGGRQGFFNSCLLGPGNFCGEELLTWALDSPTAVLPSSTRTVKAISEVEAFALISEDLKFVALQFRLRHSKQLLHKFRFYSHQWRTWAACYIQAAWRRYRMRKELVQCHSGDMDIFVPQPGAGLEVYAARLLTNMRMGGGYTKTLCACKSFDEASTLIYEWPKRIVFVHVHVHLLSCSDGVLSSSSNRLNLLRKGRRRILDVLVEFKSLKVFRFCIDDPPRVQDEIELERRGEPDEAKKGIKHEPKNAKKNLLERTGSCFETKSRSRVFPEEFERAKTSILDPRGPAAGKWNMIFFTAGLVSLFVDPLFFFLPIAQPDFCFDTGRSLQIVLTIARTVYDVFYVVHIFVQFRTAYIAPSSRVFGRGELVIDPWKIAYQYLVKGFWADVMAAVPLPQILVWAIMPNLSDSVTSHTRVVLWFTILLQYFLRVALIYPLSSQIVNSTGVMTTEKAWVGAAYNMMLYILASHNSSRISGFGQKAFRGDLLYVNRGATRVVLEKRVRSRSGMRVFILQLRNGWGPR
ncbi:hypothetical protein RHGRI_002301 [Rhododendron griersonianum]|uniref:Cyclic nucleotide-binding domain-containing protein n=1 Tax=Rhododendron griersonianum TaxID=479676 RepID=A0AAV6LNC7_9ERIC|nr:hypothetical protein RHGRI_002301 [Rhododendron griersonianum]